MKLLFRTDGDSRIGLGHVMRCQALAQAAQAAGHTALFALSSAKDLSVCLQLDPYVVRGIAAPCGSAEDARETAECARACGAQWIIVDGYHFDGTYQRAIVEQGIHLLFIDDYGHGSPYSAHLILNQNSYAERYAAWYGSAPGLLLGNTYTMLRQDFLTFPRDHMIPTTGTSILVTLGGSDAQNMTVKIIEALRLIHSIPIQVTVIVGGANPNLSKLMESAKAMRVIVDAHNMPTLMSQTDLAIAAGGTTSYELAFMGIPSMLCTIAQNQTMVAQDLAERHVCELLGDLEILSAQELATRISALLLEQSRRLEYAKNGQSLIDGKGVFRVLSALENYPT